MTDSISPLFDFEHSARHGASAEYNGHMNGLAESVAHGFVRAINRQDVEALAELMAPEHRFIDSLGTVSEGREKMRAAWTAYFRLVPDYAIAVEETLCDGPVVVMLGVARGTYSPDGQLRKENQWETPAALRALIEDGKVVEWRVYADNEPIRQKMKTP
ncbi:MAG: nuclear transport factor 2 family protein [Terracidiphilus sp.]